MPSRTEFDGLFAIAEYSPIPSFLQRGPNTESFRFVLLQVHLRNGVYMAKKHLGNCLSKGNTDSKFIGLVARGLWRADELLDRSVSGKACRRLVKDGATAKEELTPIKVDAMEGGWFRKSQVQTLTFQ